MRSFKNCFQQNGHIIIQIIREHACNNRNTILKHQNPLDLEAHFVWTKKKELTESSNYFLSTKQLGDQGQSHIKQCQFSWQYRKISAIYFCK